MVSIEELWADVELAVCPVCGEGKDGTCTMSDTGRCPLRKQFIDVVNVVRSVSSADYATYVQALRSRVCPDCRYIRPDGSCPRREHDECALDHYHPLVIDALEEALFGNPISIAMSQR